LSVNTVRGETVLRIGGQDASLCLTLGALAEIEGALGCKQISDLQARLRDLSAQDLVLIVKALLRGGGETNRAASLTELDVSPAAAMRAVSQAFRLGLGE